MAQHFEATRRGRWARFSVSSGSWACAGALLGLCGCLGTGEYYGYDEEIPAAVIARASPASSALPMSPQTLPPVLSLAHARGLALEQNPDIAAARARVNAARARIFKALSAYLPTIDAKTDYAHTFDFNLAQFGSIPGLPSDFVSYQTSFEGTWLLFDGFVREFNYQAARWAREESAAAYKDVERLLIRAVEHAYHEAQLALEGHRIAVADSTFNAQLLQETLKRKEVGKASRSDVYNFEFRLKAAQGNAVTARNSLTTYYIVLEELLGLRVGALGTSVKLEGLEAETPTLFVAPSERQWLAWAERKRPDFAQWAFSLKRRESEISAVRSSWFPSLVLSGQYGWQRIGNMRYTGGEANSALILGLGWNLFSGGSTAASLSEAYANRDESTAQLRKRALAVFSEIRQALSNVKDAQEKVRIEERSAELAALARDDVRTEYRNGRASLTRLNEVQRDFVQAQARHAQARIHLRQAWSGLKAAAGGEEPLSESRSQE